ncbi:hypothetical protein [Endozoicomonas sp.]|uniref:hypothetical protein n=1 Tax=Endozoicomonas sp. TaxID=1892382 RepID=UPI0028889C50|nr:hypothetical protein [Endozoicomonas sp.]
MNYYGHSNWHQGTSWRRERHGQVWQGGTEGHGQGWREPQRHYPYNRQVRLHTESNYIPHDPLDQSGSAANNSRSTSPLTPHPRISVSHQPEFTRSPAHNSGALQNVHLNPKDSSRTHKQNIEQSVFITTDHESEPQSDECIANTALRKQIDQDFLAMEDWILNPWVEHQLLHEVRQAGERRQSDDQLIQKLKQLTSLTIKLAKDLFQQSMKKGYTKSAQWLLAQWLRDNGVNITTYTDKMNKILAKVVGDGFIDMAERADWLLANGASKDTIVSLLDNTTLCKALKCGYLANAEWLIKMGARLEVQDEFKKAISHYNIRVGDWLIKNHGAKQLPEAATLALVNYVNDGLDGKESHEKVYGHQPAEWLVKHGGASVKGLKQFADMALPRLVTDGNDLMAEWLLKHNLTTIQPLLETFDQLRGKERQSTGKDYERGRQHMENFLMKHSAKKITAPRGGCY